MSSNKSEGEMEKADADEKMVLEKETSRCELSVQ